MEQVRRADGRTLAYHAWGPVDAPLLLHSHGVPGSRLELAAVADVLAAGDVRVVAPDRPGIGHSSPWPGAQPYTYLDVADDLAALADALGAPRFAVSGLSAGGPFALAAAARHPDRVTAVLLLSPSGDPTVPGAEDGISPAERFMDRLVIRHPALARAFWRSSRPAIARFPIAATRAFLRTAPEDKAFFDDARSRAVAVELDEALRQGPRWMVEDYARCYLPWDFRPEAIRAPTRIWRGTDDQLVGAVLIDDLQARIPDVEVVSVPGTGHLGVLRVMADVLAAVPR